MSPRDTLDLAETAALAEELSAGMRHELRNHLAIIRSAAFFLRRKIGEAERQSDPRVIQFCSAIEEHIERANALVDRDTVAGRFFTRRVAPIEALACVRAAVERARVDPRIRIEVNVEEATVAVDAAEIAMALRCLIENAAEAMPAGGTVEVRSSVSSHGDRLALEVIDRGGGFAPDAVEKAMEPFFSTKESRAGLGLNFADRIARRYGGSVAIRALPPGSSVALSLPIHRAAVAEAADPVEVAPERPRLLLVDDSDGVRRSFAAVFEDEGYEVELAGSFVEARRKIAPGAPSFAVALLDRRLGDGAGTDLMPLLRAAHPQTKLVILSGSASADDAAAAGADARFDKGSDLEQLLSLVASLAGRTDRP